MLRPARSPRYRACSATSRARSNSEDRSPVQGTGSPEGAGSRFDASRWRTPAWPFWAAAPALPAVTAGSLHSTGNLHVSDIADVVGLRTPTATAFEAVNRRVRARREAASVELR